MNQHVGDGNADLWLKVSKTLGCLLCGVVESCIREYIGFVHMLLNGEHTRGEWPGMKSMAKIGFFFTLVCS